MNDLNVLLAAIDNALRNGSAMTGANLAMSYLCDRLGVDRDALVFDLHWSATWPDEESTPLDSPASAAALRVQLAAWLSADQAGYDPDVLAEAAESLLDRLDAAPALGSPARSGICGDLAPSLAGLLTNPHRCVLTAGHVGWHENDAAPPMRWSLNHESLSLPAGESAAAPDMRSRRQRGRGALATGGIITDPPLLLLVAEDGCAPAVPVRADKAAPVSPPVDALLAEFDDAVNTAANGPEWLSERVERLRARVSTMAKALWAAGVEEGRRELTKIQADVLASAREVAAEAGFGPAAESITVSYDVDLMAELRRRLAIYGSVCEDLGESGYAKREPADVKGVADAVLDCARQSIADAFARGVAEGRRQATEERTEEQCAVAPIVWLEFVVALAPGTSLLGQTGIQAVLDRLGVVKTGDTAVRGVEPMSGDFPAGTSFIAYTVPVTHG